MTTLGKLIRRDGDVGNRRFDEARRALGDEMDGPFVEEETIRPLDIARAI